MAKTENTAKNVAPATPERVTVTLPRARYGEEENLFIGINGVNYLIPKGKPVDVPTFVAEEIKSAQAAEDAMYAAQERMLERTQN